MVVIVTGVGTGKQGSKRNGMEFLIYLDKVVICLRVQEKSNTTYLKYFGLFNYLSISLLFLLFPP